MLRTFWHIDKSFAHYAAFHELDVLMTVNWFKQACARECGEEGCAHEWCLPSARTLQTLIYFFDWEQIGGMKFGRGERL
jgi:hypothetical protein